MEIPQHIKAPWKFKHGHFAGDKSSPTVNSWRGMIARCTDPKHNNYDRYGGRGIRVCDRWLSFENFLADMGSKPSATHSIDRLDADKDYEPGNCRWATTFEQQHFNKRDVKLTPKDVHIIRKMWSSGVTQDDLATLFGVHQGQVSRIVNGKRWHDLPIQ